MLVSTSGDEPPRTAWSLDERAQQGVLRNERLPWRRSSYVPWRARLADGMRRTSVGATMMAVGAAMVGVQALS